jgi:hypothetical protein
MDREIVALADFGGTDPDALAAWVTVDGQVVLAVVTPPGRAGWDLATEEDFHAEIRRLAEAHHLDGQHGDVALQFAPPEGGSNEVASSPGEPVDRTKRASRGRT